MKRKAVSKLPKNISYEEAVQILQGQTSVPASSLKNGPIETNKKYLIIIKHLLEEIQTANSENRFANVISSVTNKPFGTNTKRVILEFNVNDKNNEIL